MENQNKQEAFHYTYSAKQQLEIQKIRQKYVKQEEDKMEQLRRLDNSVTKKGSILSLIFGIIGTLVFGLGMCFAMDVIEPGSYFGIPIGENMMLPGILIGIVGIAIAVLAYPLYTHITKKEREKIAPEIIRLTDELMK